MHDPASYDLGLIIPLREEFDCAREIVSFAQADDEGEYAFYPFTVPGSSRRGIAVVLHEMGRVASAMAATYLLDHFDLRMLALAGIAGSLTDDLRLGDVVIASSVHEYFHTAKANPGSGGSAIDVEWHSDSWQVSQDIFRFASGFRYRHDGAAFAGWQERAWHRLHPDLRGRSPDPTRHEPDYLVTAIASGDFVGAAAAFAQWIRQRHRQCAALEMEAGGAARVLHQHGSRSSLIVVRGISDFADERKRQLDATSVLGGARHSWRHYAGVNAVDLLMTMIADPAFPWRDRPARSSTPASGEQSGRGEGGRQSVTGSAVGGGVLQIQHVSGDVNIGPVGGNAPAGG